VHDLTGGAPGQTLHRLVGIGGQVLCTTHSPLLTALPGATILQLDDDGIAPVTYDELDVVDPWKRYLADPWSYLRHVIADPPEGCRDVRS
jgi:predicted ATPase